MASITPVSPPIVKRNTKPIAKRAGTVRRRAPAHTVASQENTLIPVGTAMTIVAAVK